MLVLDGLGAFVVLDPCSGDIAEVPLPGGFVAEPRTSLEGLDRDSVEALAGCAGAAAQLGVKGGRNVSERIPHAGIVGATCLHTQRPLLLGPHASARHKILGTARLQVTHNERVD